MLTRRDLRNLELGFDARTGLFARDYETRFGKSHSETKT
jgi:hypothetical protein